MLTESHCVCCVSTLSVSFCIDDNREQCIGEDTARIYGISRESCDTYTSAKTIGIALYQGRLKCSLGIAAVILGEQSYPSARQQRGKSSLKGYKLSTRGVLVVPWGPERVLLTAVGIGRRKSLATYCVNIRLSAKANHICTFDRS